MRKGLVCGLLVLTCLAVASAQTVRPGSQIMMPDGKGGVVAAPPGQFALVDPDTVHSGNGINYHGGPIMPNTPNVYLIFYGKWKNGAHASDSAATKKLVKQFITGISGSGYEMINSTYGDNSHDVTGLVNLAGSIGMAYPFGQALGNSGARSAVNKAITSGKLPADSNGVYFLITSSDVSEGGFCSSYCGYHGHTTISGKDIKWSFVGNPDRCGIGHVCEEQTKGPNNNTGADGLVNIIAHELEEAISDPDLSAWWMSNGNENADACAWKWGTLLGGTLGVDGYNETFGGHNWLLQMNWENARGGGCDNFLGGPFHSN
jgi:hypothetical protein